MRIRGAHLLASIAALLWVAAPSHADDPASTAVLAAPSVADIDDPAARMRTTVLPNGLTVLTLEDRATPVVSFQMLVKVGSRDEARYTGLAHLFEHMMFKGSKNVEPERHAQLVNARGGNVNAYTSQDHTVYFEDIPSEALELVIELEHERVAHLEISEETLFSERDVVLEERRMRTEDRPMGRGIEALLALTFQAHPYRWPIIGWRSDIAKATVEVCQEFFDTYYAPNNMILAIAGDFDAASALATIERTFGRLEPSTVPRSPTEEPVQQGARRSVVHFEARAPLLLAAWHAPPSGHADAEALDVLSSVLSAGRSSRLYRKIVYEAERALSVGGSYWELSDAGIFYILGNVRPGESVDVVEALFLEEIEDVKRNGVTEDEVAKAKRQLEVSLVNGLATSHSLAQRMAVEVANFGRVRPLAERLGAIYAVTPEDVQRVARTYLRDDKRSTVHVVAPPNEAEAAEQ
ncbi:MAG: insulinase family protein [Deltaproteobacteria bacterium]|nr:insulinase family protein [Deltaproteobacteria bacterium]